MKLLTNHGLTITFIFVSSMMILKGCEEEEPKTKDLHWVPKRDTTPPKPHLVGGDYKGRIKHHRDAKGKTWCYYSYINRKGHHTREYTLLCPKHRHK